MDIAIEPMKIKHGTRDSEIGAVDSYLADVVWCGLIDVVVEPV